MKTQTQQSLFCGGGKGTADPQRANASFIFRRLVSKFAFATFCLMLAATVFLNDRAGLFCPKSENNNNEKHRQHRSACSVLFCAFNLLSVASLVALTIQPRHLNLRNFYINRNFTIRVSARQGRGWTQSFSFSTQSRIHQATAGLGWMYGLYSLKPMAQSTGGTHNCCPIDGDGVRPRISGAWRVARKRK